MQPCNECGTPGISFSKAGGTEIFLNLLAIVVARFLANMELTLGDLDQFFPYSGRLIQNRVVF